MMSAITKEHVKLLQNETRLTDADLTYVDVDACWPMTVREARTSRDLVM